MGIDAIGWLASAVLVATVLRQVSKQWRERSNAGVSKWLFAGQVTASVLFLVYSYLLGNKIFMLSNGMLILASVAGQLLYLRNRARD